MSNLQPSEYPSDSPVFPEPALRPGVQLKRYVNCVDLAPEIVDRPVVDAVPSPSRYDAEALAENGGVPSDFGLDWTHSTPYPSGAVLNLKPSRTLRLLGPLVYLWSLVVSLWDRFRQNDRLLEASAQMSNLRSEVYQLHLDLDKTRIDRVQQAFLLEQAPMVETRDFDAGRLRSMVTKYAYIHPKTFHGILDIGPKYVVPKYPFRLSLQSPTLWVLTELMPFGRVILSSNLIPEVVVPEKP